MHSFIFIFPLHYFHFKVMHITNIKKVNNVRPSQVAYVTMVGNETMRPLGVAMGNAVSVTRVWSIHTKTQLVGWWLVTWLVTAYDVTTARPHYKWVPGEYIIHRGCSFEVPMKGNRVVTVICSGVLSICSVCFWFTKKSLIVKSVNISYYLVTKLKEPVRVF